MNNTKLTPFESPLYITKPLLPDINQMTNKLKEIWESGWLTNKGHQHEMLEAELRRYLGVPSLSLFNNGTIALIVACRALRLTGEVITTPFTFPATPHVLTWNNIKPIFCDIKPETFNIDAEKIEALITPETTAIMGVHVFGAPCDVAKIGEIADRYGLKVVYDAAHAFGVEVNGRGIGNYGDVSMFSFHATKMFHTAEGGALTFNDGNLKERVEFLKNFGIKNEEEVVMPGINGKMNELQAALGLLVLEKIEEECGKRRELAALYERELKGVPGVAPAAVIDMPGNRYQYMPVRVAEESYGKSRDWLYSRLREFNVFARKYFYPLCSDYPCYKQLSSSAPEKLPVARKVAGEVLCLPMFGGLAHEDVEKICAIIKQADNI